MDLWIRSQDKKFFSKQYSLYLTSSDEKYRIYDTITYISLGDYKSEERALEVLDEIQNKIKGSFMIKAKTDVPDDIFSSAKSYFERENDIKIITGDNNFDILPLNINSDVYEMPQD